MLSDTLLGVRKFVLTDPPAGLETALDVSELLPPAGPDAVLTDLHLADTLSAGRAGLNLFEYGQTRAAGATHREGLAALALMAVGYLAYRRRDVT